MMMPEDEATLELRKKLPVAQSLKITAKDVSDYYTKAEYTSFAKPKSGKEKKMRRVRKVEEEVDPLEGIEDDSSGSAGKRSIQVMMRIMSSVIIFFIY